MKIEFAFHNETEAAPLSSAYTDTVAELMESDGDVVSLDADLMKAIKIDRIQAVSYTHLDVYKRQE